MLHSRTRYIHSAKPDIIDKSKSIHEQNPRTKLRSETKNTTFTHVAEALWACASNCTHFFQWTVNVLTETVVDYDLILTADLCCGISGLQLSQKLNKLFHSSSMKAPKSASVLWKEGGGTERVSVKTKNIANTISVLRKMLEKLKWDAETSSLTSWHDSCCPLCRGSDTFSCLNQPRPMVPLLLLWRWWGQPPRRASMNPHSHYR